MTFLGIGLIGLIMFGAWIFTLIDVLITPAEEVRSLQKVLWFLIVLLILPGAEFIGIALWFIFGRPRVSVPATRPVSGSGSSFGRGPRASGPRRTVAPDDDIDFLRGLNRKPDNPT